MRTHPKRSLGYKGMQRLGVSPESLTMKGSLRNLPPPPSEVYASSLFPTNEGYALWYPEPHESGEVQIGDVGYIVDGAFIRLFNVADDKELKIAGWPHKAFPNPEVLSSDAMMRDVRDRPLMPGSYRSDGVVETSANVHLSV